MKLTSEIGRRRTFAIISHPDAGKTTLTEKLLLFGGAIQTAGAVKSNKIRKTATSDFMEIERQRGISVATSVMTFEYKNALINLLDTPGHKDFAEDTYRTLSAVDSVILVVDCVKGVETQTEKLMEVCRMRDSPVIIFVNKLDLEGRPPFDILDELEEKLKISVRPLTWPINIGRGFKGVYKLTENELNLFKPNWTSIEKEYETVKDLADAKLDDLLGERDAKKLREDSELIGGVYEEFDLELYRGGLLAPVFFGSAVNNFGVRELLEKFIAIAPPPVSRQTMERMVSPEEDDFSGFIFKIHANLDPRHRDRIAFLRVCSGKFERNKFIRHVRAGKNMRFSNPYSFVGQRKDVIDEAYPGDVIGLYDTGNFKIGDTLTDGEALNYKGIPRFSPEIFREVINNDPSKAKQLNKGVEQLMDEGVAQLFTKAYSNTKVIGAVGELQFEVIRYRLENEYGAKCTFRPITCHKAVWVTSENPVQFKAFLDFKAEFIYSDKDGKTIFLADSRASLDITQSRYPDLVFHFSSEAATVLAG